MYRDKGDKLPKDGGHTFRPDKRVCWKCHENPESLVLAWRLRISPLLEELKELLEEAPRKTSEFYKVARQNYNMVIADGGMGIHNPAYARVLLLYSISSLRSEPTVRP